MWAHNMEHMHMFVVGRERSNQEGKRSEAGKETKIIIIAFFGDDKRPPKKMIRYSFYGANA